MPLDEKDIEQIRGLINETSHQAFSAREKRLEAKEEERGKALEARILSAIEARNAPHEPTEPETLKGQLAQLTERLNASERARREEIRRGHVRDARAELLTSLEGHRIRRPLAEALISHWSESGALTFDEAGAASLAVARERLKGAGPEELRFGNLAEAVADWSKGDAAKDWLPALAPSGNRSTPATQPKPRTVVQYVERDSGRRNEPMSDDEAFERAAERIGIDAADLRADFNS